MINFKDEGLIVTYIQTFLKENYDPNLRISNIYDKETHKSLIKYLKQPYILESKDMKDLLIKTLTFRDKNPPNDLIDGGGLFNFDNEITTDTIRFYTRPLNDCFKNGLLFINQHISIVEALCNSNGWDILSYTKYIPENSVNIKQAEIILIKNQRKQLIPGKDVLNMINLFSGDYLLNKCFLDDNKYHGYIQYSDKYKIAYIEAKPGESFTIMHGYKYPCEIAIAYTNQTLTEINDEMGTVDGILNHLNGSKYGELNSGKYLTYTIPIDADCTYLLIQLPYKNNLVSQQNKEVKIMLGDINQDGKIDEEDVKLLETYINALELGNKPPFILSGKNLIAANVNKDVDVNGNPVLDKKDLILLSQAIITGQNLGFVNYEEKIDLEVTDSDKLLIMSGDIERNNDENVMNIPYYEFVENPWLIHDEFLPYILGSTIHKFSNKNDIIWLQELMGNLFNYKTDKWGYYDEPMDFVTSNYFIWNNSKSKYEYYRNYKYTGYVLDKNNLYNAKLINENDLNDDLNVFILNGKLFENNTFSGNIVLENGMITNNDAYNSLRNLIQLFQIEVNKKYKLQLGEQIKFANGFLNPLTEKYLKQLTY